MKKCRCTPEITASAQKTPVSDTSGQKVTIQPCKCISFDELKKLIEDNNTQMPRPNHITEANYSPYKVPDQLLMAIISLEAPCEGNKYIQGGKQVDIEFDPCAKNCGSSATGLTQLLKITIKDFIEKGIIKNTTLNEEHKKVCGNPALAIKYGSWNIQLKYIYQRAVKDAEQRLVAAIDSAGTGEGYGTARVSEMKKLQKDYTKATLLQIINSR